MIDHAIYHCTPPKDIQVAAGKYRPQLLICKCPDRNNSLKSEVKLSLFDHYILLYHSQSDSDRRLSDQANSCHDSQPEEAVDDVDLEVQRLLNVYDLVKDDESLNRSGYNFIKWRLGGGGGGGSGWEPDREKPTELN